MEKQKLPNSTTILILGICSLVFDVVFVGILLGIIGIVMASKPRKLYKQDSDLYSGYKSLDLGYTLSVTAVILGVLWAFFVVWAISVMSEAAKIAN
jgi:hypothetical protein